MATLFSWDVESGSLASMFDLDVGAGHNSISTEQSVSPTHSIKFTNAAGDNLAKDLGSGHSEICMRLKWYFSSTTTVTGGGSGDHGFRFTQRVADQFANHHEFDTLPISAGSSNWGFDILDHDGGYDSLSAGHGLVFLPRDQWFEFKIALKLSSPGTANGTVKVAIDGTTVYSNTAIQFVGSAGWTQFDTWLCNSNWDNGTALWYYDDILITDSIADFGGGGGGLSIDDSAHEWFVREAQTNPLKISRW